MLTRIGILVVMSLVLLTAAGCIFGVYSKQEFGPGAQMGLGKDASLADVMRLMGAPDEVYSVGKTSIMVYKQYEAMQIMGLYSTVKKKDIVIMLEGGKMSQPPMMVNKGEALTVLGFLNSPIMGPFIQKDD